MGIKTLNIFLKKNSPSAFSDLPYSYFKGKRVAIDSDNVLRKLMSRSHKEVVNQTDVCSKEPDRQEIVERWFFHIREELSKFLSYGITPIFVFDGKYIDEKSDTQLKRKEDKEKRIRDVDELKRRILSLEELERTPTMVTELRKKMHHMGTIKPEDKEQAIKLFQALGIPVLFATEEGEKLCSMLCIEGKVDAVYSRDTDVIAMGTPLSFSEEAGWVYNKESGRTELALKCTFFKPILGELEMEYSSFLDLCIMSGCDFNSNIYRLGINTAYKLLKTCKRIEDLPEKYQDKIPILNHQKCREIFKKQESKDICQGEIVLNVGKMNKEELKNLKMEDWISEFESLMENLPKPSDCFIEKRPSYKSSILRLKILNSEEKEKEEKEEKKIPKQQASPLKLTSKTIRDLNRQQLLKLKIVS